MHVPAATPVTVDPVTPLTVQMLVVVLVKITALPEPPPVAETTPLPPTLMLGADPKLMLCDVGFGVPIFTVLLLAR